MMPNRPRRCRPVRPKRLRFKFRLGKAMFVLPNLFTVSSIFCGVYAITLVGGDPTPQQLYAATLAVFFGAFFDGADGRVARLTRTQSAFGVQLDSLADVITFGVAPALIVHKWALASLDFLGLLVAFVYVACGAIRLARFNVLAARNTTGAAPPYFVGLPIPLAASVLMTLVMFHQRTFAQPPVRHMHIVLLMAVLSYLMVSNVRYRTFKHVQLNRQSTAVLIGLIAAFVLLAERVRPTFALLMFAAAYVASGLLEAVLFFKIRRQPPSDPNSQAQTHLERRL